LARVAWLVRVEPDQPVLGYECGNNLSDVSWVTTNESANLSGGERHICAQFNDG